LICDGRGTPLKVITTAANVNDVTQTLALVDSIPPVAGRPGHARRRPEALLGDKGYDSNANRNELRKRRILPVISRKGPRTSLHSAHIMEGRAAANASRFRSVISPGVTWTSTPDKPRAGR
jgi:IS5 family transposase